MGREAIVYEEREAGGDVSRDRFFMMHYASDTIHLHTLLYNDP